MLQPGRYHSAGSDARSGCLHARILAVTVNFNSWSCGSYCFSALSIRITAPNFSNAQRFAEPTQLPHPCVVPLEVCQDTDTPWAIGKWVAVNASGQPGRFRAARKRRNGRGGRYIAFGRPNLCASARASSPEAEFSILADVKFLSLLYLLACLTSASVCGLLIAASREIPRLSGRLEDLSAVQRAHDRLTPRVGGLGIIAGLLLGMLFVSFLFGDPGLGDGGKLLAGPVLLVVVALAEDLGFRIRPWTRLIATVLASLYVGLLTEIWLRNLGMGPLNPLFDPLWVAIPVTLFVTAMLSHGFNLIDGVNGLSSGVGLVGALGCSFISFQVGADAVGII